VLLLAASEQEAQPDLPALVLVCGTGFILPSVRAALGISEPRYRYPYCESIDVTCHLRQRL
jgi:hypothetical protein